MGLMAQVELQPRVGLLPAPRLSVVSLVIGVLGIVVRSQGCSLHTFLVLGLPAEVLIISGRSELRRLCSGGGADIATMRT